MMAKPREEILSKQQPAIKIRWMRALSLNLSRGFHAKLKSITAHAAELRSSIVFLQEIGEAAELKCARTGPFFVHMNPSNHAGVGILLHRKLQPMIESTESDKDGRYLQLNLRGFGPQRKRTLALVCVYMPTGLDNASDESPVFARAAALHEKLKKAHATHHYTLCGGDFTKRCPPETEPLTASLLSTKNCT